jgi:hypothetical protein
MELKDLVTLLRQEKPTTERDQWIWLIETGRSVTEVFTSEGVASVALYEPESDAGMADALINEMSMAGVGVSCVVTDDAAGEAICAKYGVKRVSKSEFADVSGLDFVVIISPENYHRQMIDIRRSVSAEVVSLKGLIDLMSSIYEVHLGYAICCKQYNIRHCVLEWPQIGDFNDLKWLEGGEKIVFSPKEYQENPDRFSSLYDDLPEYSPDYIREIFQERPIVQVGDSVMHADCAGRHVNIINGRRLTAGQPDEAECGVYVLGGCMAWGIGTDDRHTISSFLQGYANEYYGSVKNLRCAVYNLGVWGASPVPYIDFMQRDAKRKKLSVLVFRADGDYPKDEGGRVHKYIKKFMDKHGICYISLTETLREAERRGGTYLDTTHTNHRGYRAVARKVFYEFVRPELEKADAGTAAVSNPLALKWEKLRAASRSVSEFFTSQGMCRVGLLFEEEDRGMFAELAEALTRDGVGVTVFARDDAPPGGVIMPPGVNVSSLSDAGVGENPDIIVTSAGEDVREDVRQTEGLARTEIVSLSDVIELVYDRYYLYPEIARRFAGSGAYLCVCLWPEASDLSLVPAEYARIAEPLSEKMLERNYGYFKTYLYNEIPDFSIDYLKETAMPGNRLGGDQLSNADRRGKYVNVERGVRRTVGQPKGASRRVRVFGGGEAFGMGAEDKYTLPSLLQEHLNTHAKNFGTEFLRVENDGLCRDASDGDVLGRIYQALDKGDVAAGDVVIWLAGKKYSAQDKTRQDKTRQYFLILPTISGAWAYRRSTSPKRWSSRRKSSYILTGVTSLTEVTGASPLKYTWIA